MLGFISYVGQSVCKCWLSLISYIKTKSLVKKYTWSFLSEYLTDITSNALNSSDSELLDSELLNAFRGNTHGWM